MKVSLVVLVALTFLAISLLPYALAEQDGGALCDPAFTDPNTQRNANCSNNGDCVNNACVCDCKYTDPDCSQERKNRLTALLLQIFLGAFGAGYFYLEIMDLGALILCLFIIGWCLSICGVGWLCLTGVWIWQIIGIVFIATGQQQDGDSNDTTAWDCIS